MDELSRHRLNKERQELEQAMLSLEMSDERLYTNGNGNWGWYKRMQHRVTEINIALSKAEYAQNA